MKIEHVAFNVADPVAMATWYEINLSMRTVRSVGPPTHTRFLADSNAQVMIEIYKHPEASVPDYRKIDPLILHLAFAADDVRATRARLLQAGCTDRYFHSHLKMKLRAKTTRAKEIRKEGKPNPWKRRPER